MRASCSSSPTKGDSSSKSCTQPRRKHLKNSVLSVVQISLHAPPISTGLCLKSLPQMRVFRPLQTVPDPAFKFEATADNNGPTHANRLQTQPDTSSVPNSLFAFGAPFPSRPHRQRNPLPSNEEFQKMAVFQTLPPARQHRTSGKNKCVSTSTTKVLSTANQNSR